MSRPLYRGFSSGSRSSNGGFSPNGSFDPFDPSNDDYDAKRVPENGFVYELFSKPRKGLALFLLKLGIAVITILAFVGSLSWAISISSSSNTTTFNLGYRKLQEQLISDLLDIGQLSLGVSKSKETEVCPPEFENYVPCFYNLSEIADLIDSETNSLHDRKCSHDSAIQCLILPPRNYRIPLRWPSGKDFIWKENVKITGQEFSSGSLTKRMMVEEEQISFRSDSLMVDGVEDYSHQIAEMIGLRNESNFNEAGIRTVLDIGCGFGSFGAHLFSKNVLTMCIADYEGSGSQVQLTLERGLPAIIGSFTTKQLPYPFLSFDMIHCARCELEWDKNEGIYLVEVDRLLRPGGYFVWTSLMNTHRSLREKENQKKWNKIREFCENLCWELLSQQDETVVWKKTINKKCHNSKKSRFQICGKDHDFEFSYYQTLNPCIYGTKSQRWVPIEYRSPWPSQKRPNSTELQIHGINGDKFSEDVASNWGAIVRNYWSLLSPLIFSDHPKRPGDEEPQPPFNMLRNILDMNAKFGGFNEALLDAGKSVWVMNVVPVTNFPHNYLPFILDRGFVGVQHDWCEAFPTYPRTYDMVHGYGLLSLEKKRKSKCTILDIFLEVDRILRPEGWVIIRDISALIESTRLVATQLKWDSRIIDLDTSSDEKLLVCQKTFFKKQL